MSRIYKTVSTWLLVLVVGILVPLVSAAGYQAPKLTGRVVDTAKLFTNPQDIKTIENALIALEKATGGQMVVVTLPPVSNYSIEEIGIALGEQWKIGTAKEDNGVILVIIPESRENRLEIGRGLEGQITDGKAGAILREMRPYFRENQFATGVLYCIQQVNFLITGQKLDSIPVDVSEAVTTADEELEFTWEVALGLFIIAFPFILIFGLLMFFSKKSKGDDNTPSGSGGYRSSSRSSGSSFDNDSYSGGGGSFSGGGSSDKW